MSELFLLIPKLMCIKDLCIFAGISGNVGTIAYAILQVFKTSLLSSEVPNESSRCKIDTIWIYRFQ